MNLFAGTKCRPTHLSVLPRTLGEALLLRAVDSCQNGRIGVSQLILCLAKYDVVVEVIPVIPSVDKSRYLFMSLMVVCHRQSFWIIFRVFSSGLHRGSFWVLFKDGLLLLCNGRESCPAACLSRVEIFAPPTSQFSVETFGLSLEPLMRPYLLRGSAQGYFLPEWRIPSPGQQGYETRARQSPSKWTQLTGGGIPNEVNVDSKTFIQVSSWISSSICPNTPFKLAHIPKHHNFKLFIFPKHAVHIPKLIRGLLHHHIDEGEGVITEIRERQKLSGGKKCVERDVCPGNYCQGGVWEPGGRQGGL